MLGEHVRVVVCTSAGTSRGEQKSVLGPCPPCRGAAAARCRSGGPTWPGRGR
uniref:Uncharacterized protein n=1 Tax=Anguilla anguilla TaxID=7936 RepID=A0A0E9UHU1_ANGAN